MSKKVIRVVAGDRGGWNAIEPPLVRALDAGCAVRVFLTATCGKQFLDGKLCPDKRMDVMTGMANTATMAAFFGYSEHHLMVIGASQSKEGTEATKNALMVPTFLVPRLGVQDMYGSIMPTLRLADNAFDCLCVSDEFARSMVLKEFPGLGDRVVVTGGPQFDKTIEIKKSWNEKRRQLREAMHIDGDQVVFLVVGGLNGTAETLKLLEEGIEKSGFAQRAKVILRTHPRATDEDKYLLKKYLAIGGRTWFTDADRALTPTSEDLLPGVDFVLSGYGTTNYFGILCGMSGVVYVGTPAFKRDLKAEKGLDRPPEVDIGAGWYVQTGVDLARVVVDVRHGSKLMSVLKLQEAQKKIASFNDGHATDRVWGQMQRLMDR